MGEKYQIIVLGQLDKKWSDWLGGLSLYHFKDEAGESCTSLSGILPDQSALLGVLQRLVQLNIALVTVKRTGTE